jgi:hypothetical protein
MVFREYILTQYAAVGHTDRTTIHNPHPPKAQTVHFWAFSESLVFKWYKTIYFVGFIDSMYTS